MVKMVKMVMRVKMVKMMMNIPYLIQTMITQMLVKIAFHLLNLRAGIMQLPAIPTLFLFKIKGPVVVAMHLRQLSS